MLEKIKDLEKKGFRINIFPQLSGGNWYWTAGVCIGDNKRAVWIDSKNNLAFAMYLTYEDAFNAVINYCNAPKRKTKN